MVECRKTLFAVVALVAALGAAASARAQGISEFALPTNASNPYRIAAGSDGNLWFTEIGGNKIGRITPSGVITEFPIPTANSNPQDITAGPDNNLWFTEDAQAGQIGRITTSGAITEFAIPTTSATPAGIIAGPDGNLWFAESVAAKIGRSTPAGAITEFAIPGPAAVPFAITAGSDGALWFTLNSGNTALGRITTSGAITQSTFPTTNSNPEGIVSGPDGALWFTEASVGNIRTVNTLATATAVFPIPTANSNPFGIAAGADGNLWFTEQNGNKIGRITTSGAFTEFAIPTANSEPQGIAAGPDGALWFVERLGNKIGRIAPPAAPTTVVASVLPSSQSVEVGTTATATATLINGGSTTASRCAIAPIGSVPATFSYQALAATGANTPVDIPAGGKASFSISLTPTVAIAPGINVTFSFACANAPPATVLTGINTLFLSAATAPVPNVVAAAIVANNSNGILVLNQTGSNTGAAQFSVSTTNQGIGASLTVSANTGAVTLPVTIALCQTAPTSGQCLAPPGPSVTLTINAGATPTFAVFVTATGVIPFNFNNNRIFVQFTTSTTGPNAARLPRRPRW
jgi:virginiamycin B lyase